MKEKQDVMAEEWVISFIDKKDRKIKEVTITFSSKVRYEEALENGKKIAGRWLTSVDPAGLGLVNFNVFGLGDL
ncbi:hypothetical protein [Shewanella chilikensis]|uniref:hypothetical protein n=1 Tax=Shewanella chilikensis TaxID=558541 RepID=UPI003A9777D2